MSGRDELGDAAPRPGLLHRLLHGRDDLAVGDRFRAAVLKPADPEPGEAPDPDRRSVEELRNAERYADDSERFLGLMAAPLAAAIGFFVANYLIEHDPPATLSDGQPNKLHGSITTYHTLELVLLGPGLRDVGDGLVPQALFLGMAMALYGLGVFNLHYWGFGVPFLLAGAWLLVRAYRAHQAVRTARARVEASGGSGYPAQGQQAVHPAHLTAARARLRAGRPLSTPSWPRTRRGASARRATTTDARARAREEPTPLERRTRATRPSRCGPRPAWRGAPGRPAR